MQFNFSVLTKLQTLALASLNFILFLSGYWSVDNSYLRRKYMFLITKLAGTFVEVCEL